MIKNIEIKDQSYNVTIKKSKRAKHLQLRINRNSEISLIVPNLVTYYAATEFLNKSTKWLEKKISKLASYNNKFRYLGNEIVIELSTTKHDKISVPSFIDNTLIVSNTNAQTISEAYESWLFDKANEYIPIRAKQLAERYGFSYNKVTIKKLKSRWGSCSSQRNVSFNYKLMYFNTKVIDYVIVHELCHLSEMNHSDKFWKLVEAIVPDYKKYKRALTLNYYT